MNKIQWTRSSGVYTSKDGKFTIKSDGIKPADLNGVRDGFRKKFPENDCLVFAVAPNDSVDLSIVSADKGKELSDDSSESQSN